MVFSDPPVLFMFVLAAVSISTYGQVPKQWDYFVFAQRWPASFCINAIFNQNRSCVIANDVNTWTVHGLWPTKNGSRGPNFCNRTAKFVFREIESIVPDLEAHWPDFYNDTPTDDLWKHEWEKHGTCSMTLPSLDSQLKYFSMGLDLFWQINLTQMLSDGDIRPSSNTIYEPRSITDVLSNAFGHDPIISCFYYKETQYLFEIGQCFNKTFGKMACPENPPSRQRCNDSDLVVYPDRDHIQLVLHSAENHSGEKLFITNFAFLATPVFSSFLLVVYRLL